MPDYFTLLRDRVTLKCRSIDRIFLQAYVPKLQTVGQVCTFLRWQRRFPVPSSAAFGKIGDGYVEAIYAYAKAHNIPVVRFEKGQDKEKTARPFLEVAAREGKDRVVLIGIAQEKASVWRSWKSKGQEKAAHPHMEWGRQMAYINHFYFYLWDSDWGAAFWKTNAYAPYPIGSGSTAMSGLNGNSKKLELLMRPSTMGSVYKSSRIKQYFKEGRALRTETVICNTQDFGIGRRVCAKNWCALRAVGESANRRLCEAESAEALPAPDVVTFHQVTRPSNSEDGLYTPALRFGDPRVMAVLASLVGFCHLVEGFNNRQLVQQTAALLDAPYATRQATYDLRRLKRKGLILKTPHSHRYQLTPLGRRVAVLFTKTYGRVLAPGLILLDPKLPDHLKQRNPLATAWRQLDDALDDFTNRQLLAA